MFKSIQEQFTREQILNFRQPHGSEVSLCSQSGQIIKEQWKIVNDLNDDDFNNLLDSFRRWYIEGQQNPKTTLLNKGRAKDFSEQYFISESPDYVRSRPNHKTRFFLTEKGIEVMLDLAKRMNVDIPNYEDS